MADTNEYNRGDGIVFSSVPEYHRDTPGDAAMTISVTDPAGTTVVDAAPMVEEEAGIFEYLWQTEEDDTVGFYTATCRLTANAGANKSVEKVVVELV
jgi:uncharacterized protein YfaS (alpha-2-macroglobulin family)